MTSAQKRDWRDTASSSRSGLAAAAAALPRRAAAGPAPRQRNVSISGEPLRGSKSSWPSEAPARPCGRRRRSCPARPGCSRQCAGQAHAGVHARRARWRPWPRPATAGTCRPGRHEVGQQDVPGQPVSASRGAVGGREVDLERRLGGGRRVPRRPPSSRPRRRGGRRARKARATSCGLPVPKIRVENAGRDVLALVGQGVEVGQDELARLDLLLDLGGLVVAQEGLQGVAGDDESRVLRAGGCCRAASRRPPLRVRSGRGRSPSWSIGHVDDQAGRMAGRSGGGRSLAAAGGSCRRSGRSSCLGGPGSRRRRS